MSNKLAPALFGTNGLLTTVAKRTTEGKVLRRFLTSHEGHDCSKTAIQNELDETELKNHIHLLNIIHDIFPHAKFLLAIKELKAGNIEQAVKNIEDITSVAAQRPKYRRTPKAAGG